MKNRQQGFALVAAIFIMVILGLLGGYMVNIGAMQSRTAVFALQGDRAYQAARAGMEWGNAKIAGGGDCNSLQTLPGSFNGLDGFSVQLDSCEEIVFTEGAPAGTVIIFKISSEYGSFGSADYIYRQLESKIID